MTPGDPWTQQVEAFGRFFAVQRKLAKRQLRELAARTAGQQALEKIVPAGAVAPTVDGIPTAHDLLRDSFAFSKQLLVAQRDFTDRVVAAARPVLDKQA